jgi:hemoglobin/transferrin/lactoferrin receptor protein
MPARNGHPSRASQPELVGFASWEGFHRMSRLIQSLKLAVSTFALACVVPSLAAAQQAQTLDPIIVKTPLDGTVVTTTKAPAPQPQAAPQPTQASAPPAAPSESAIAPPTAIEALSGSSAVSKAQIDTQFQADRTSEILRTLPGVTTQETARDTAQSVNIRGLQDFGRVNVLIDGMRQNFQRSGHSANGVYYLEPEMLKRVDITRGPTATIYGSGAIGGVVAFELIDADDVLKPGETVATRLKTRFSTNGFGPFGSAAGAVRVGNFDIVGQLNGRDVDDYKDGSGNTILFSGERTDSGLVRGRWRSNGHQVTGTYIDYQSRFVDAATDVIGQTTTTRDSVLNNDQVNLGYTFARPDTPLIDLSAKLYRNETDLAQVTRSGSNAGRARGFNIVTEGIDVWNTSRFEFGASKLAITIGGDTFRDRVSVFDNNAGSAGNADEFTPNGERQVSGAFTQGQLKLWNFIDVIGALRYDQYSLEGGTTSSDGSRVSPKITVGVTPINGITVFATYAEGYRAPAITETLVSGVHPAPATFRLVPNPNLRPEVAHTIEGGVNLKYDGVLSARDAFRAKAVVFQNDVDDFIGSVFRDPGAPCGAPVPGACDDASFQYQNIAKAYLHGVELEAAYDAKSWFMGLSAHRIRGTDETTGQPLLTVPADQVALTAGIRPSGDRLVLGGRVRFVAAQDRVPTGAPPADAYTIADVFAQYRHSETLVFNLNVDNMFDQNYRQYLDQSNSPGLNARIGMTMQFGK